MLKKNLLIILINLVCCVVVILILNKVGYKLSRDNEVATTIIVLVSALGYQGIQKTRYFVLINIIGAIVITLLSCFILNKLGV